MSLNKNDVLTKICYTNLVYERINKKLNLALTDDKIEELVSEIIKETDVSEFYKRGKNIYIENKRRNIKLTINSFTYRIITADKLIRKMSIN